MTYPTPAQLVSDMQGDGIDSCVERLLADDLPFAFDGAPDQFDAFRIHITSGLGVRPDEITLVGSGRFGFSLDPNRWGASFSDKSDLDIVVVSGDPNTLDRFWAMYDEYETEIPDQSRAKRTFIRAKDSVDRIVPDIRATRWHNKSDFYSLFIAVGQLTDGRVLTDRKVGRMRKAIATFSDEISRRMADEAADVSDAAAKYVRAVQRGSTEKSRRVDRHEALLEVLGPALTT